MNSLTKSFQLFINLAPFKKFVVIFFITFPILLISGPFLSDLSVSIIAITILYNFILKNQNKIFFYNFFLIKIFLIFYIYINLNSIIADYPKISLQSSFFYIRIILFSFFIAWAISSIKEIYKIIVYSFLFVYIVLFIDSTYQVTTGYNLLGFKLSETNRVSSFFREELIMGSFISKTFPLLLACTFIKNFKCKNFLQTLILILSGSLIYLSNERAAFFSFFVIAFFYLICCSNKKFFLINILIFFLTSFLIYNLKPNSIERLYYSTINQFKETKNFLSPSYRHELHYLTAINIFKHNLFFGTGIKSFRYNCSQSHYSVVEKIEKDNVVYSNYNGFFFIEDYLDSGKIVKRMRILKSKDNAGIFFSEYNISGTFFKVYKKNGNFVKNGEKLFSSYEFSNGCNTHPHNIYLQFLAELGIIGFIFITSLFFYILYYFTISLKNIFFGDSLKIDKSKYSLFIILNILLFLLPIIPSGNFFNNWYAIVFAFQLGFFLNLVYPNNK